MQNKIKHDYAPDNWARYTATSSKTSWLVLIALVLASGLVSLSIHRTAQFQGLYEVAEVNVPVQVIDVKTLSVQDYIRYVSEREGYDTATLLALAKCESGYHPNILGPQGELGLYQIHPYFHPEAYQIADDIEASTIWAGNKIKEGQLSLWACSSKI